MESQGKFAYVRTAAGEFAITIDGKPAGLPVGDEADAITIREWLDSALADLDVRPKPPGPVDEERMSLAWLIDRGIDAHGQAVRLIMIDTLISVGPVWHTFGVRHEFKRIVIEPGGRALLYMLHRNPLVYREGYIPSWVPRVKPWDESSNVALPPATLVRLRCCLPPVATASAGR